MASYISEKKQGLHPEMSEGRKEEKSNVRKIHYMKSKKEGA